MYIAHSIVVLKGVQMYLNRHFLKSFTFLSRLYRIIYTDGQDNAKDIFLESFLKK